MAKVRLAGFFTGPALNWGPPCDAPQGGTFDRTFNSYGLWALDAAGCPWTLAVDRRVGGSSPRWMRLAEGLAEDDE